MFSLPSMSTVTGRTSVWFVMVELYAAEPTSDVCLARTIHLGLGLDYLTWDDKIGDFGQRG